MLNSRQLNRDLSAVSPKISFLFTKASGSISLPMNIARNTLWEPGISKLVMKLVRNADLKEREADGAVHWKSIGPFGKKEEIPFRILIG